MDPIWIQSHKYHLVNLFEWFFWAISGLFLIQPVELLKQVSFLTWLLSKLHGTGYMFGDYSCVDCISLSCASRHKQFVNIKFTRPVIKIWKWFLALLGKLLGDNFLSHWIATQSGNLAFYKNSKHVRTVQLTREHMAQELYASVGISSPGGVVRAVHMSGAAPAAAGKIIYF